jgi:UDP-glucose:(heptosyl)LPS alpha-1,3-glucosyltransferase
MRITICCKQFVQRGGAEAFLATFARRLLADGHAVKVLTPEAETDLPGIEVARLAVPRAPHGLRELALARASARALAGDDADVTFSDQRCWGARVVRLGGGVQRAYVRQRDKSYRGALPYLLNRLRRAVSLRERIRIYVDERLYAGPGPRLIIANSDMVRRQVVAHYPHVQDRVRVVYNGADTDRFRPELRELHRPAVRRELGIPEGALVLVFVGHDWQRKGLRTVVDSLGILARKGTPRPVFCIVVGRGSRRRALAYARRRDAEPALRFVGPARPDRYYAAADLFALPSYYDPCANVTLEALACGLPVLTSAFNGAHELLTPGVDGFYVNDAGDAAQLAGFIEHYLDGARLAEASEAARALAEKHSLDRMYGELLEVLREAAPA